MRRAGHEVVLISGILSVVVCLGMAHALNAPAAELKHDRWAIFFVVLFSFLAWLVDLRCWQLGLDANPVAAKRLSLELAYRIAFAAIALRGCYSSTLPEFLWWTFALVALTAICQAIRGRSTQGWDPFFKASLARLLVVTVSLRLAAHPLGADPWLGWSWPLWCCLLGFAVVLAWEIHRYVRFPYRRAYGHNQADSSECRDGPASSERSNEHPSGLSRSTNN